MSPRVARVKPLSVGTRLRQARQAAGMTLRELAVASGGDVTAAYLSRIEGGSRYPSLEVLIDLAEPLGITGLFLLTGKKDADCPCCGRTA